MKDPKSPTRSFKKIIENNLKLPEYQRDFAWDFEQMKQLWDDLRTHLFTETQTEKDSKPYYLGAAVIDDGKIVDGQQRLTTMTLISCAVRDALIASGYIAKAHTIQQHLISEVSTDSEDYEPPKNKFSLHDKPQGQPLSSEYRIQAFRKRIVDIPLGLFTDTTEKNHTFIKIDAQKSKKISWSVDNKERWRLRLWDKTKLDYFSDVEYITIEHEDNELRKGSNPPTKIRINRNLSEKIPPGLELVLMNNVEQWDNCNCSAKSNSPICDLFHKPNREFYQYVRTDAEHFLLGKKDYTPKGGIKPDAFSTGLTLRSAQPTKMMRSPHITPDKEQKITFYEPVPDLKNWHSDDELWGMINEWPKTSENRHVELKTSFLSPTVEGKIRKNSHVMIQSCMRAVASMLNTKGGYLFIGIRDDGFVKGLDHEIYKDEDRALMSFEKHTINYLGSYQEKHVELKFIYQGHKKVLVVKIDTCNIPTEMTYYDQFDQYGGRKQETKRENVFFVKNNQSVDELTGVEKHIHIQKFISNNNNEKLIEHDIQSATILKTKPEKEPSFNREVAKCAYIKCAYVDTNNESLKKHMKKCSHKEEKINKDPIPKNAFCVIEYRKQDSWRGWLDSGKKRANEISKLIQETCFTVVEFRSSMAAIDHFMLTNDSSRFVALNSYDLVSAFTIKLMRVDDGEELSVDQRKIRKIWSDISEDLYISTNKDGDRINSFFFNWLLATGRRERPSKRYTKDKSWNGMKKEFEIRTNDDGTFKMKEMLKLYQEMKKFAQIYLRLINTRHALWNENPYDKAVCRDERNYLRIISAISAEIQHIPPVMCLINHVEENDYDRDVIRRFLKNYNYILLRYKTIPVLVDSDPGIKGGDIYSKMQGVEDWISLIIESDLNDKDDLEKIAKLPLELEDQVSDVDNFPWIQNHDEWPFVNQYNKGTHKEKAGKVRHVLFSLERALETQPSPKMARIHPKEIHAEHIVPQNTDGLLIEEDGHGCFIWPVSESDDDGKVAGRKFIKIHKRYIHSLGNKCILDDSVNSSIKDLNPASKFSIKINNVEQPFKNSEFLTARAAHEIWQSAYDKIRVPPDWGPAEMEELSKLYMQKLIEFYQPE